MYNIYNRVIFVLIGFCFIGFNCSEAEEKRLFRLPNTTFPTFYNLNINTQIDKNDFLFHGVAKINLTVIEETYDIFIHIKQMNLEYIKLSSLYDASISLKNYSYDSINEFLSINCDKKLKTGNYQLEIKYNSTLRTDKLGFYRSSYLDNNGKRVWLAATQFAPTEARHAFPCYDEPRFKAKFQITITHSDILFATSNTDILTIINNGDGTKSTVFNTSPLLPTYLVGFIISDFEKISSNRSKFIHEMYARYNALNDTKFAEQTAGDILEELMDHFSKVKLPLTTMKQNALPDFHFSGMENFGLVTYKESKILFDQSKHGSGEVLNIIYLLAHEMAHQWFGNLVTMAWWTHVWLKEGFSTLYGYYIPDKLYPEWKIMHRYQTAVMHFVFQLDGESKIRPMTYYVEEQKAIMKNYDKIAYEKSSCVLRMIDHAMGHDAFNFSIESYLESFQSQSVNEDDLFFHLEKGMIFAGNTDVNITNAFRSWTSQSGYPVVTVKVSPENQTLNYYQERFLNSFNRDEKSLWIIPINYMTKKYANSITKALLWIDQRNGTIKVPNTFRWTNNDWIILNVGQTGYYRVNYDLDNWNLLIQQLIQNHEILPSENRAQLLDDSFNLASVGRVSYSIAFEMIRYMENECNYSAWSAFETNLLNINRKISEHRMHSKFKSFLKKILLKPFENLVTFNRDAYKNAKVDPLKTQTQKIILRTSCRYELDECLKWQIQSSDIELRSEYFCKEQQKNFSNSMILIQILRTETDSVIRNDLIFSFACTSDIYFIKFLLQESINLTSIYNLSDLERKLIFHSIIQGTIIGLNISLEFILSEWRNIKIALPENGLDSLIIDASKYVNNQNSRTLFYNVLENIEISDESEKDAVRNVLSTMEWSLTYETYIETWLDDNEGLSKSNKSLKLLNVFVMFVMVWISVYI